MRVATGLGLVEGVVDQFAEERRRGQDLIRNVSNEFGGDNPRLEPNMGVNGISEGRPIYEDADPWDCERLATTHQPVTARLIDFIQVQDPDETSITHLQIGSQPSEKGTFPWNFGRSPCISSVSCVPS
jgi:hypothetical protein